MNAFQGLEPTRDKGDFAPDPPGLDLFARIEGLCGEEAALLAIPAHRRDGAQRERLHAIAAELDRAFERLRERAERLTHRAREEPSSS
ncbi:MAG: hypothetical protein QOG35_1551 [Solirubrobacteraceae bacterium]|jgi:hypothetical protein|nr:hypothetical protein [Solirubrobacteraceae bacterium]